MVTTCLGLPHACGGVSVALIVIAPPVLSSPRMWGCFRHRLVSDHNGKVFPTHVGVFPASLRVDDAYRCLPHACGGVSEHFPNLAIEPRSSARMSGCFCNEGMMI